MAGNCPLHAAAPELCDEAAAQIAQLLMDLALCFENTHFAQIRHHHQTMQTPPERTVDRDCAQLKLFEDLEPF